MRMDNEFLFRQAVYFPETNARIACEDKSFMKQVSLNQTSDWIALDDCLPCDSVQLVLLFRSQRCQKISPNAINTIRIWTR